MFSRPTLPLGAPVDLVEHVRKLDDLDPEAKTWVAPEDEPDGYTFAFEVPPVVARQVPPPASFPQPATSKILSFAVDLPAATGDRASEGFAAALLFGRWPRAASGYVAAAVVPAASSFSCAQVGEYLLATGPWRLSNLQLVGNPPTIDGACIHVERANPFNGDVLRADVYPSTFRHVHDLSPGRVQVPCNELLTLDAGIALSFPLNATPRTIHVHLALTLARAS